MKKLLMMLGALSVGSVAVTTVVACNNNEQMKLEDYLKNTGLGEIKINENEDQKNAIKTAIITKNTELANTDLEDINVTYQEDGQTSSKITIKGYNGSVIVIYTIKKAEQKELNTIITNKYLGYIKTASVSDITKAIKDQYLELKNTNLTITNKKTDKGQGSAHVKAEGYKGQITVNFNYGTTIEDKKIYELITNFLKDGLHNSGHGVGNVMIQVVIIDCLYQINEFLSKNHIIEKNYSINNDNDIPPTDGIYNLKLTYLSFDPYKFTWNKKTN